MLLHYLGENDGDFYLPANWQGGCVPDGLLGQSADLCGKRVTLNCTMDGSSEHPGPLKIIDSVGGGCLQIGYQAGIVCPLASDSPLMIRADFRAVLVKLAGGCTLATGRYGTVIDESGGNVYGGGSIEHLAMIGSGNNIFDIDGGPGYGRYGIVSIDGGPGHNEFRSGIYDKVVLDDGEGCDVFSGANIGEVFVNNGAQHSYTVSGGLIRRWYDGMSQYSTYRFDGGLIEVLDLSDADASLHFCGTRILNKTLDGGRTWS